MHGKEAVIDRDETRNPQACMDVPKSRALVNLTLSLVPGPGPLLGHARIRENSSDRKPSTHTTVGNLTVSTEIDNNSRITGIYACYQGYDEWVVSVFGFALFYCRHTATRHGVVVE